MATLYRTLADLVLVLHLVFIMFVLLGGLLALRWRRASMVHLPAAAWGAAVEFFGWICPLTPLEGSLRGAGGGAAYSTSFVEQYIVPLVYPVDLTRGVQLALGTIVVFVNAAVYVFVVRRGGR